MAITEKFTLAKANRKPGTIDPLAISGWKYISVPNLSTSRIKPKNSVVMAAVELTLFHKIPNKKTAVTGGAI